MTATIIDRLLDRVLAAAVDHMTAPNGEPFEVDVDADRALGEAAVTYRLGATVLGVRRFRVAERSRVVSLPGFELPVWWFDGTSIHEQFVANLSAADADGCVLSAVLTGSRPEVWTPYFDWARGMGNANAAALAAAVQAIAPPLEDDESDEPVWGGSDLPERVQLIVGPDPSRSDGRGSWRHVVGSTTPAGLVAGLDDLHDGLAQTVFTHVGTWYGERIVG